MVFEVHDSFEIPNIIGGFQEVDFMIIIILKNMVCRILKSNNLLVKKKNLFFYFNEAMISMRGKNIKGGSLQLEKLIIADGSI